MNVLETKHTLCGWTIDQWSLAISRVGIGGTTMAHINRCQADYQRKFGGDPSVAFAGEKPEHDLAMALFENVNGIFLEPLEEDEILDTSYADHTKDDMEYDEAWQNRYGKHRV